MARKELFTTIRTEGAILPSDLLQRIGALDKNLPGLKPPDYGLAPTERINEAIARSWSRMQGLWIALREEREKLADDDPALALTRERWLLPLFDELGYGQLRPRKASDDVPISHSHGEVPIHLLGVGVPLDRRTPKVPGAAKRSPHAVVQDYLNGTDEALHGFVSNGRSLRLLRDNSSLTRQAFVEFNLEDMFGGEVYPDFSLLWLTCHATRVAGDPPASCLLERWSQAAAEQGARALDRLREGVKDALVSLGGGFLRHPANQALKDALRAGDLSTQEYYRELLRVVYRLLFLFVAEDRQVLHPPEATEQTRARYARHFSTRRLRELARRHRGGRHPDLWHSLQVVLRALGDLDGLAGLGVPSLGGLFAPGQSSHTDGAQIANHELLAAVRALSFTREGRVVRAVDYRNLGPEEFGSVYESLLELHPGVQLDAGSFAFIEAGGSERKTTGSYYTPPSLVQSLLDSALDPVLDGAAAAADPEAEILGLRVVDPASGSGHFLIAAAHRIAQRLAAVRSGEGSPAPEEVRRALRDVVGRCLYGVDVNPMAVELCKVSLWIEAVEPGKPLSFLDAHIRCGNSLVGATPDLVEAGVPVGAFQAITGDDKEVAKERKAAEKQRQQKGVTFAQGAAAERLAALRTEAARFSALPDDTPRAVAVKAEAYAAFIASESFQAARAAFDAWCAAFYLPKNDDTPEVGSDIVAALLAGHDVGEAASAAIAESARRNRFFQWHLEFPDVMSSGGFDCVLGNPPWDQVQLDDEEFFAVSRPDIAAAGTMAKRKRMLAVLEDEEPSLHADYMEARHEMDALQGFIHESERFPKTSYGRLNVASLFAELVRGLISSRGRVGVIVPTGIATDSFNQYFFAELVNTRSLVSIFGFENEEFIFPGIHHATKFCLLTMSGATNADDPEFVFFARHTSHLHEEWRRFALSPEDFALLNPNTRTCPIFRSRRDAEITKAVYRRVGVLVDESGADGNPWGFKGVLMFMMNTASHLFRERADLEAEGFELHGNRFLRSNQIYLPLSEGKMIHHFDHRFGTYDGQTEAQARQGKLPELTDEQHADSTLLPLPHYWVHEREVSKQINKSWTHDWFLGWRDITGAVVQRTVIASILPRAAVGNNLPLALLSGDANDALALVTSLSALATDFLARFKVGGTHLNFFIFQQLAVPSPALLGSDSPWGHSPLSKWLVSRALELVYTAWDLEGFARDLGYEGPPYRWDPERRFLLRAELDAAFFHLYGISREDTDYVLDTFRIVRENEEKRYGSYRTKEVVLDLYDRMAKATETGEPYQTVLDPPPADPSVAHLASTRPSWAVPLTPDAPVRPTLRFVEPPPKGKARERYAAVVSLKAAAGAFGAVQEVEPEGWVELPDGAHAPDGSFVAQVVGRSMEPTIPDGAWCLFGTPPAGSRTGKILVVQHHDIADPETGGSYTVKRYHSEKSEDAEKLWRHARIFLEPDNPEFEAIALEPDSEDAIKVVGEFLRVVDGEEAKSQS